MALFISFEWGPYGVTCKIEMDMADLPKWAVIEAKLKDLLKAVEVYEGSGEA